MRECNALVDAVRRVAEVARREGERTASDRTRQIVDDKLAPVDPLDFQWNVFRVVGVETYEVSWTQWLAVTLRPENGAEVASLTWQALCDAALLSVKSPGRSDSSSVDAWRTARQSPPGPHRVYDE